MPDTPVTHSAQKPKQLGQTPALDFAARLISWQQAHGRHHLPWQHQDAYRVWVSEIMLQQTQVATVLKYYPNFIATFPNAAALASAPYEEVAAAWSGLGFYRRAKHLHAAAKQVVANGHLPKTVEQWQQLKGVGKSTAGAVHALGQGGFGVILDGNVKRVLARHTGFSEPVNTAAAEKKLWALAHALTPKAQSGVYAQALMDLGSQLCTPKQPECVRCPVAKDCTALAKGVVLSLPVKKAAKPAKQIKLCAWVIEHTGTGKLLFAQHAKAGVWEGLWGLVHTSQTGSDFKAFQDWLQQQRELSSLKTGTLIHKLSHIHIEYQVTHVKLSAHSPQALPDTALLGTQGLGFDQLRWMDLNQAKSLGVPITVEKLLKTAGWLSLG